MGYIRFYLALAVAISHAGLSAPMNASYAVQFFFVISGYYMAQILDGPYKGDALRFYANRALRIFPAYWIVAGVTFALMVLADSTWPMARMVRGEFFDLGAVLANLLIFGQDFIAQSNPQLLLVVPAWSIAMELYFYLLAPLLVRVPTRYLIVIGLVLSWQSQHILLAHAQLCFFIAGIVIYRTGFKIAHESKADTFLGKLSYPLYLIHYPVIHVFGFYKFYGLAFSLALSVALLLLLEPLERVRGRIREPRTNAVPA